MSNLVKQNLGIHKQPAYGFDLPEVYPIDLNYTEALVDRILLQGLARLDKIMNETTDEKMVLAVTKAALDVGKYTTTRLMFERSKGVGLIDDLTFLNDDEEIRQLED